VSAEKIKTDVEQALGGIINPRHGRDIVAAGMVKEIVVDSAGAVTFTFVLTREDPGSLARQARKAVEGVPGVTGVKMNVVDSADGGSQPAARPSGRPAAAPPLQPHRRRTNCRRSARFSRSRAAKGASGSRPCRRTSPRRWRATATASP